MLLGEQIGSNNYNVGGSFPRLRTGYTVTRKYARTVLEISRRVAMREHRPFSTQSTEIYTRFQLLDN